MHHHRHALLPSALILGGAAAWGILWLPLRYTAQHGLTGAWAALAAFLWPAVVLAPLVWRRRSVLRPWARQCIAFGVFSGLAFGLYAVGLVHSSVVRVTLLFYLTPVWSALTALVLLGEATRWQGWLAAAVGIAGLALILGTGGEESVPLNFGDACALSSGISWALAVIVLRRHPHVPALGTVFGQFLFASACIFCLALVDLDNAPWPTLDAWMTGATVTGLFSTVILLPGLFGIFWAAGRMPPARVGVLMMTEVLVAVVSASIILDEAMNALEWTGAALIMAAALIEVAAGRQRAAVAAPS